MKFNLLTSKKISAELPHLTRKVKAVSDRMPANDNHVDDIEWLMHLHIVSASRSETEDRDARAHMIGTMPSSIRFDPGRSYFSEDASADGRDIDLLEHFSHEGKIPLHQSVRPRCVSGP